MIIDINFVSIDIGSKDDIDSIIWEQSGNISRLFVTHKDGDLSFYKVEHEVYVEARCRNFKGDTLQKFFEKHECKALFFNSICDSDRLGHRQGIVFMNDHGIIYYDHENSIRLISVSGYNIVKDKGYYITCRKLPESLINSLKELCDDFQVVYKLNILTVMDSESYHCKVKMFEFDGKCGEIIEDKETGKIVINSGRDCVEFNGDLDIVSRIFGEEFAAAFKEEVKL